MKRFDEVSQGYKKAETPNSNVEQKANNRNKKIFR